MNNKHTAVATLIVRGGGSTFYRKNLYPLLGKPVVQHAIEILQRTSFITDIVIWTEDKEIKEIGRKCGVIVLDRPRAMVHYYGGFHTLEDWYINRANQLADILGYLGDYTVNFNCNNILVRPESLEAMYNMAVREAARISRVHTVVRVNPGLCLINEKTHSLFPFWSEPELTPGQHPPLYRLMGVSVAHTERSTDSRYKTAYYELADEEALDFQTSEDVLYAEYYLMKRQREQVAGLAEKEK